MSKTARIAILRLPVVVLLLLPPFVPASADAPAKGAPSERPPDMLVVVLDSLRADALEREVEGEPVMPKLREWSRRGTAFTRARAPSPSTPTSVSSWLTSLPVQAYGGTFVNGVPAKALTVAELLKGAGYATLAYSANPNCRPGLGHDDGFELFFEAYADAEMAENGRRIRSDHPAMLIPPEVLFAKVRADLQELPEDEPAFVYVHILQPHAPYDPDEAHEGLFTDEAMPAISVEIQDLVAREKSGKLGPGYLAALRARYDEHVHWTDAATGAFLEWVDANPRWSDAAIVVTSDHGEAFGEHGRLLHNTTLYEEMLRVPLVLRLPGGPAAGNVVDEPVGLLDLAPTFARLAGLDLPDQFQGVDVAPLARGQDVTPRQRFLAATAPRSKAHALLIGETKLIRRGRSIELYDLEDDPSERRDLAQVSSEKAAAMRSALERLLEHLGSLQVGTAPVRPNSAHVESILRSLGYTGDE